MVFGFYDQRNAGDDRFAVVIKQWLNNHHLTFLPHTEPPPLDLLRRCDYALVGGGTIASSPYGIFADRMRWIRELKIPVFGVGLGVHEKPGIRDSLAAIPESGGKIWVRDRVSLKVCDFGGGVVDLGPDLAWLYPVRQVETKREDFFAVNARPCPWRDFNTEQWSIELAALDRGVLPWPLCFGKDDDRSTLQMLLPNKSVPDEFDVSIISRASAALLMRFHAVIFAVQTGTPFLHIQNAQKVRLLLKSIGLEKYQTPVETPNSLAAGIRSLSVVDSERLLEISSSQQADAMVLAEEYRTLIETAADVRSAKRKMQGGNSIISRVTRLSTRIFGKLS